jgi:serine protease Do
MLAAIVFLSFASGIAGGVLGMSALSNSPRLANFLNQQGVPTIQQQVILQEDSAVVDVVKRSSPAVVSIVISKDLNKIPGFGINPFEFDPFSPFFSVPNRTPSSEPNVQQVGAGSGFFVSADGLILTNKHVVSDEQATYTVLTNDGTSYQATVLTRDPVNDLAIVKVDIQDAPTLSLADSAQLEIGQRVIAIGNSLGQYQNTVTTGVVSGIGRSIVAGGTEGGVEALEGVIQTDAAINPGNSGGPLLNSLGQVIGINTAVDREGQLVGFAIPSNDAQKALDSFRKTGRITRPFLGIRYVMITPALAEQEHLPKDYGALIIRGQSAADVPVVPGSAADKAGLKENDIILEVNGQKVEQSATLSKFLKQFQPGDVVRLKVHSQGQERDVNVTLGENN